MRLIALLGILLFCSTPLRAQLYEISSGMVRFHSEAPKELISAQSTQLRGIIDPAKKTFAFRISLLSFRGFNNALQQEHFNENYMETPKYPEAAFSGKIVDDVDFSKEGAYEVRAKGKFHIHGLDQERIVKARIVNHKGVLKITADFTVLLADHDIKIPRVVYDKLAPEIKVSVNASLQPRL